MQYRAPSWWLVACAVALSCGDGAEGPEHTASSSSIVLEDGGARLWLTSPDDDRVVAVDPTTLEAVVRVDVPGGPEHLARVGDELVVTMARTHELAVITRLDDEGVPAVARMATPCGGTRAIVPDGAGGAWVSCPNDDLVIHVDVQRRSVTRELPVAGRPTALAIADDRLTVSRSRSGALVVLAVPGGTVVEEHQLSDGDRSAIQVDAIAVAPTTGRAVASFQLVDNANRDRPPEQGGYGSVTDDTPRIEPMLHGHCGPRYARFDGGARVFSGPSALAPTTSGLLWVVNQYTDNVAVLDCRDAPDGLADLVTSFRVGRGPRGIALAPDGRTAFVDVGFAHAVAKLELDAEPGEMLREPTLEVRRELGESLLSEEALRGRSVFHDAVDTHLTPSGVVTCATCHPGGGEDGLTWFLHTTNVPRKLRRTPPAWAAKSSLRPFHWDGELDQLPELVSTTIVELMEGDGLLVDTEAVATWLEETPPPPQRPLDAAERERADRGRALFESEEVGCAGCHAGEAYADGEVHRVVSPSEDEDAALDAVDTPTLLGVRARPPYLHDGRAATLRDVVTTHNAADTHGATSHLTEAQLDDLLVYLETL